MMYVGGVVHTLYVGGVVHTLRRGGAVYATHRQVLVAGESTHEGTIVQFESCYLPVRMKETYDGLHELR
eukprot:5242861-Pleurochrysis_carterae.AAC.2